MKIRCAAQRDVTCTKRDPRAGRPVIVFRVARRSACASLICSPWKVARAEPDRDRGLMKRLWFLRRIMRPPLNGDRSPFAGHTLIDAAAIGSHIYRGVENKSYASVTSNWLFSGRSRGFSASAAWPIVRWYRDFNWNVIPVELSGPGYISRLDIQYGNYWKLYCWCSDRLCYISSWLMRGNIGAIMSNLFFITW